MHFPVFARLPVSNPAKSGGDSVILDAKKNVLRQPCRFQLKDVESLGFF
jgi:hypothetical protein